MFPSDKRVSFSQDIVVLRDKKKSIGRKELLRITTYIVKSSSYVQLDNNLILSDLGGTAAEPEEG